MGRNYKLLGRVNSAEVIEAMEGSGQGKVARHVEIEACDEVKYILQELCEHDATLLVLRHFKGLTYKQIAELIDCATPSAQKYVLQAERAAREVLQR
jgi:DNA-directed RNA polymerase specialized sigma24 family protein